MNDKLLKAAKVVVPVAGLVVSLASSYLKDKEFDEKVAKKVAELTKANGEES